MDDNTLSVTCPGCGVILIVHRKTGKILEKREPILEQSTGDRIEDAFKKARESKDIAMAKFEEARARERDRKAKLESLFKENLDRVRESGEVTKPMREIDLE